ncbi:bifunctional hydroxymethylpyrimidine kinase/phosphomethylpyrimidine kinase [Butyrivibrio sp. VCD2006]|uniref:bifunctional hydroxymethylpyrimidine kinase/phosphomethylpyrimidine kinase n=1 Tax=Butyrivibrio sp. VCD2006 TaxID=1280664 RepID=UPI0004104575|nr:bifunctional hydroxymethylpyrimidine kinase/phosphomethylpyrimidine kinase [Butyrivibrio sp. VCD2006]
MKIAAINDLSGFGKCSLVADMTVLSAMGIQCCPIPTAVLSAQTGYPSFYSKDLTGIIPEYTREWKKQGECFDGIITGFMMSKEQAINSLEFIRQFKTEKTTVLVDPVMGDDGRTYKNFSVDLLHTIREMTKDADIITPNLTELILLAGDSPESVLRLRGDELTRDIFRLSMLVGGDQGKTIAVTGIPMKEAGEVGNFILEKGESRIISSGSNGLHYSGTGDLFAAVFLGAYISGKNAFDAADTASRFIYASVKDTPADTSPNSGVEYEKNLKLLMQ